MVKRQSETTRQRVKLLTDEDIAEVKTSLQQIDWIEKKKRSATARLFEQLRSEIETARQTGVSWPVIAEAINERLGTRIHPATIRSYFSGQKLTAKDERDRTAFDMSKDRPQQPDQAARSATPTTSPVSGS